MTRTTAVFALISLVAAASCGGDKGSPTGPTPSTRTVSSIEIGPATATVEDGGTVQLTATVRDQNGQAFQSLPAGTTIVWSSVHADVAGVNNTGLVTGEKPGQATIRAAIGQVQGERNVTVTQRAALLERVDGDGQQGAAGSALAEDIMVRVLDRHGDAVPGIAVQFVVTAGGGAIDPATANTDEEGVARAIWTLGTEAGDNEAEARASGLDGSPVTFAATSVAGPAAVLEKANGDEQEGQAGTPLPAPVVARVTDAHGNAVAGVTVTWTVVSGGGSVNPTSSQTNGQGLASTSWTPGAAGANSVSATAAGQTVVFTATAEGAPLNCSQQLTFGDGAQVQGPLPSVRVTGNVTVSGTTHICGNLVIDGAAARLVLGGNEVTVDGSVTRNSGRLTMTNAADRLIVGGNVSLSAGSSEGDLTHGIMRVAGNFTTTGTQTAFVSTGTEVRLDGSAPQTVTMHGSVPSGTRFHRLVIDNSAGVTFAVTANVQNELQISANTPVQINAGATVTVPGSLTSGSGSALAGPGGLSIGGALNVGGSYGVGTTTFTGANQQIPALAYSSVIVAGTAALAANTTMSGSLTISNANARLTLAGRELTVGGSVSRNSGRLTMTNAADRLIVGGSVSLSAGSSEGDLTHGVIRVAGNFTTTGTQTAFVSTGTEVRLDGNAPQTLTTHGSVPNGTRFHRLVINNAAGVTFAASAVVQHELQIAANTPVQINAGATVTVPGSLISGSGSALAGPGGLSIGGALNVGGSYGVGTTTFTGANQQIPALAYSSVIVAGTAALTANTTLSANLTISNANARLTLAGRELTVGGSVSRNSGRLTMTNASDRLIVGGNVSLSAGSSEGDLTHGVIHVAGDFTTTGTQTAFVSTGTEVRLDGSAPQTLTTHGSVPNGTRFHRLVVDNTAGVTFAASAVVQQELQIAANTTVQINAAATVTVPGSLTSGSGSVLAGPGGLSISGVLGVGGSYGVGTTTFTGANQEIPALAYGSVIVAGTATLAANTAMSGNLTISNANARLTLAGRELTVGGSVARNSGRLTMTNANDRLIVGGSMSLSAGSSEGDLTHGVIRVAGNFTTTGTQTAFVSTGTAVRLDGTAPQTVTMHGSVVNGTRFHNLLIENTAGVTFNVTAHVSNHLDLVGTMTVNSGVTIGSIQMLFLRSSAVLNNNGTIQTAACTKEGGHTINGTDPC